MRGRILVAGLALLVAAAPALAAGGGSGSSDSGTPTATDDAAYKKAEQLIKTWQYAEAVPLLHQVVGKYPDSADAHNYLGYSHRKLGDKDKAMEFYAKALQLEPGHRGANAYLGELYLELGDLPKAEDRLAKLDSVCFFGCPEHRELKAAIDAYKKRQPGRS